MNFTPVERQMAHDYEQAPRLDDSPSLWAALLLPPLVVGLTVAVLALSIWDTLRRLVRYFP